MILVNFKFMNSINGYYDNYSGLILNEINLKKIEMNELINF